MLNRILAFLTKLFFIQPPVILTDEVVVKPVADEKVLIDPMDLPKFRAVIPHKTVASEHPMRLKRGERMRWTNRGFYRGYHGPVVRV